jgi:MFS family permease
MVFNPILLAAMSDVGPYESGLASGLVNTSFMMGGALGLVTMASVAAAYTDYLLARGLGNQVVALNAGYHVAFWLAAMAAAMAAVVAAVVRSHPDDVGDHSSDSEASVLP